MVLLKVNSCSYSNISIAALVDFNLFLYSTIRRSQSLFVFEAKFCLYFLIWGNTDKTAVLLTNNVQYTDNEDNILDYRCIIGQKA